MRMRYEFIGIGVVLFLLACLVVYHARKESKSAKNTGLYKENIELRKDIIESGCNLNSLVGVFTYGYMQAQRETIKHNAQGEWSKEMADSLLVAATEKYAEMLLNKAREMNTTGNE